MNAWTKTLSLVAAAGVLSALVYATRPVTREIALISEQGEPLAPALTDPLAVKALEVISYDTAAARTRAFNVAFDGKRWVIPSHSGYPADAADKMSAAASAFAGLVKERFITGNKADHATLGVLAPDDETSLVNPDGIGTRVTLRDASGRALVDVIIGKPPSAEPGAMGQPAAPSSKRYVRQAGDDRVYLTALTTGFSTKFVDWVQTDLLQTTPEQIIGIQIDRYQVDEDRGTMTDGAQVTLTRQPAPQTPGDATAPVWTLQATPGGGPGTGETVNEARLNEAISGLTSLRIVGVRPKPANLAKALSGAASEARLTIMDQASLGSRGFYLAQDSRLLASEGQMALKCADGVVYGLWFGKAVPDTEDAASGGAVGGDSNAPSSEADKLKPPAGRYMMITVSYDATLNPEPAKPAELIAAEEAFEQARAAFEAGKSSGEAPKPDSPAPETAQPEGAAGTAQPAAPPPADQPAPAAQPPAETPELLELRREHEEAVKAWKDRADAGRKRAESLGKRFADWYYVISAESLGTIRPTRDDLVKAAPPPAAPDAPAPAAEPPPGIPAPPLPTGG